MTLDAQLLCRETTKYPIKGMLHDFARGDAGLRST
jgi:hypothetical protein